MVPRVCRICQGAFEGARTASRCRACIEKRYKSCSICRTLAPYAAMLHEARKGWGNYHYCGEACRKAWHTDPRYLPVPPGADLRPSWGRPVELPPAPWKVAAPKPASARVREPEPVAESPCALCAAPVQPWTEAVRTKFAKGHVVLCRGCWERIYDSTTPRRVGAWRGRGSCGARPGAVAGDGLLEDIARLIEEGPSRGES